MREVLLVSDAPPLPTIPTGQTRTFGMTLPEAPTFEGPGSGTNPSGALDVDDCRVELMSLIAAVEATPSEATMTALINFIEGETGSTIEELAPDVWEQVKADGVAREATVEVCGCLVTLIIDGTLVEEITCLNFPKYTLSLLDHDYHLESIQVGSYNLGSGGTFARYEELPEFDVHLENPRLQWILVDIDNPLVEITAQSGLLLPTIFEGALEWMPTIAVNGYYTAKPALFHTNGPQYSYEFMPPPVGFKNVRRSPSGGTSPTIDDPYALGVETISGSTHGVDSSDYCSLTLNQGQGQDEEFKLGTVNNILHLWPHPTGFGENADEAWEDFVAECDAYTATAGDFKPTLTVNEADRTVTVSFMTRNNAFRMRTYGCAFSGGSVTEEGEKYDSLTVNYGGYYYHASSTPGGAIPILQTNSIYNTNPLTEALDYMEGIQERIIRSDDGEVGYTHTSFGRAMPAEAGTFIPEPSAFANQSGCDTEDVPTDAEPPPTVQNPPIVPVGGGCRSRLFGPSSCNWTVPVPASPQPEVPDTDVPIPHVPNFPMPHDHFPDVPTIRTHLPNIPKLPCIVPDFGNIDPCGAGSRRPDGSRTPGRGGGAGPGYMGPLPGGRDRMGHRGDAGTTAGVKTAGPTFAAPDFLFLQTTCPGQVTPGIGCMAVIVQLLMDCGVNPIDIIFQVGPEWDKPFPPDKCFSQGSRMFDAAMWTAQFLMLTIVDEGAPTNDVYIGPPWHRPLQTVWTFDEHYDLFNATRNFSSEEPYGWVEVFGPNVTSPIISRVDDPFSTEDSPTLRVEVGWNFSQGDAEDLAAFKASVALRQSVSIQATVPYSSDYFLRDLMELRAPDRGFQETYVIVGKESDVSAAGWFHILTGMLPATLAELDQFPEVTDEYSAVDGGFA